MLLVVLSLAALLRLNSSLGTDSIDYSQRGDAFHVKSATSELLVVQGGTFANSSVDASNASSAAADEVGLVGSSADEQQGSQAAQKDEHSASSEAEVEASLPPERRQHDSDELMTPELIARIEAQNESDWSAPMHAHLLWVGDLDKAPKDRFKYLEMGFNLTVHTSPEEILEGFHPYVLRAYYQAIPSVVGCDFLKFAMLYKYGGLSVDADTSPVIHASQFVLPTGCELLFGKEAHIKHLAKPVFRESGTNDYGYNRPFQILNWAMAASRPRNPHIKWMLKAAMMHFFGLRDMERSVIQDVSGSGLVTDYVALLHEKEGRSFAKVYEDPKCIPVEGICLADQYFNGKWIRHSSLGSWKLKKKDTSKP
ncbi:hypothetical protein Gpo141_00002100 [Globisporangium polare]